MSTAAAAATSRAFWRNAFKTGNSVRSRRSSTRRGCQGGGQLTTAVQVLNQCEDGLGAAICLEPTDSPGMHLTDRVQRLESWAFAAGADVADIKAAVEQLPGTIGQEILDYTSPVLGEIMAGRATLATRQDVDDLKREMSSRFASMDAKLDRILAALGGADDQPRA
ncbi:hypothetical protein FE391_08375 [Nonomuraea sp. KC401]|uniref:hypothetical protein n=1 Tax=unclassified Nonomuraea TaxID=2593643 RepID=UPI0010FDE407|nr:MULTISPECIES: hypothetical protein [unclassified Nonomuraea]NBE93956.1 hypothetical protein [Nonomuraea sp. K271]TLF80210.1 hypothetical protein FE391_08375 [Nonomuraea sp. KC401]